MFAFDPNAGLGGEVLALVLFGDQGVDEGGIEFGSLYLDVEMIANAFDIDLNRGGFDDDFFHFGKTALGITSQGIAPNA
jgi:hypothetical protein